MARVITFRSTSFDVSGERPNPVNPIAGESVLKWLGGELRREGYEVTEPDTEDWGWYVDAGKEGARYLVGASAELEPTGPAPVDWAIQIHKHRTLMEKLTGKNTLGADDALCALVETLFRDDPGTTDVDVQQDA